LNSELFRKRRLFLSSNSVYKDRGYLEHSLEDMIDFLGDVSQIIFIPFAGVAEKDLLDKEWADYTESPRKVFSAHGREVLSIHTFTQNADKKEAVKQAEAIFIGGGNTHHLLFWLKKFELIEPIRERLDAGVPMMGSSAGTNVFCPTICTTNDMPIISNSNFDAIGGVPFQINPHYLDPNPDSDHRGETREQRINEFLKVSGATVLGLREGSWLRIENGEIILKGLSDARLFKLREEPIELSPGENGQNISKFLL
jgi:dipeptidase E